ncbi:MAG: hypothetical protein LLF94_01035 [Chlamydiales bacterium]|nr:hypothetical protein [Chlamydiales bacterium]
MQKICLSILACVLSISGYADSKSDQIQALDKEIKEFKDAKERASMQAYQYDDSAGQHLNQDWEDYEEDIKNEEQQETIVKELDEKIKQLESQKEALEK